MSDLEQAANTLGEKLIRFAHKAPMGLVEAIKVIVQLRGAEPERLAENRQLLRSLRRFIDECLKIAETHAEENAASARRLRAGGGNRVGASVSS